MAVTVHFMIYLQHHEKKMQELNGYVDSRQMERL